MRNFQSTELESMATLKIFENEKVGKLRLQELSKRHIAFAVAVQLQNLVVDYIPWLSQESIEIAFTNGSTAAFTFKGTVEVKHAVRR